MYVVRLNDRDFDISTDGLCKVFKSLTKLKATFFAAPRFAGKNEFIQIYNTIQQYNKEIEYLKVEKLNRKAQTQVVEAIGKLPKLETLDIAVRQNLETLQKIVAIPSVKTLKLTVLAPEERGENPA